MGMRFASFFAAAAASVPIFFGCSTSSPEPADASVGDAAPTEGARSADASPAVDAKADSATCQPAGAPCDDPFACCSMGCVTRANPGEPATSVCQ